MGVNFGGKAARWMALGVCLAGGLLIATAMAEQPGPAADSAPSATAPSLPAPSLPTFVGDENSGAAIYENVCSECHGGLIAPPLRGVYGSPVARLGTYQYSAALKTKSDLVWSDANLDAFIKDPSAFAPGTDMDKSLTKDQDRADVIAFLKTLPPPRE